MHLGKSCAFIISYLPLSLSFLTLIQRVCLPKNFFVCTFYPPLLKLASSSKKYFGLFQPGSKILGSVGINSKSIYVTSTFDLHADSKVEHLYQVNQVTNSSKTYKLLP